MDFILWNGSQRYSASSLLLPYQSCRYSTSGDILPGRLVSLFVEFVAKCNHFTLLAAYVEISNNTVETSYTEGIFRLTSRLTSLYLALKACDIFKISSNQQFLMTNQEEWQKPVLFRIFTGPP